MWLPWEDKRYMPQWIARFLEEMELHLVLPFLQEWQPHSGKLFQQQRIWIFLMPLKKAQVCMQLRMILWDTEFLISGRLL